MALDRSALGMLTFNCAVLFTFVVTYPPSCVDRGLLLVCHTCSQPHDRLQPALKMGFYVSEGTILN